MRRVVLGTFLALGAACSGDGNGSARTAEDPPRYDVGHAATPQQIAAIDLDVSPDGHGLPAGQGTYDEGAQVYASRCAQCHGAKGEGQAANPKLVSPPTLDSVTRDSFPFDRDFAIPKTVGNYWPYATTLYDYVKHAMPYDHPGSLTPNEVYSVVAYILAENQVVPKTAVMDARTLPAVKMPARARFVPDDRTGGATFR